MAAGLGLGLGAIGMGMSAIGTALHKGLKVPEFNPINLTESQGQTIAGNLANAPASEALASRTTNFNQQQLLNMLRTAIPNYDALQEQTGKNLLSMTKGEIPPDVVSAIKRASAGKALAGGYAGGTMKNDLTARDLGTTSLALISQGMDAASRWIAMNDQEMAPAFTSSTNMFFTPQQRATADMAQNQFGWQVSMAREEAKNKQANLWSDWLGTQGAMLEGMGFGGGGMLGNMGGGGGGGGYSFAGTDPSGNPVWG